MKRSTLSFAAVPFEKSIIVADYDRRDITPRMSTTKNVPIIRILSNMSKGDQIRDYLPIEKVAKNIVAISTQNGISGIINCCSGAPITVKQFTKNYLNQINQTIKLNLGHYPYSDLEPFAFWGDNNKLKKYHASRIREILSR